ncbi:SprB repeat-containing protein [Algoriphagus locisalis]|uniref:SprB repeat-containing protein n=1 Tax=Algoriphagus locisalis TaxID=305507 RepID=A0A1I6YA37_9BACT|nr:SprB repeat-containing protein [Algoriphagus locisalis]SFT47111.1 SprB repeat-containing protein [Algoriphagus locisalis]
MLLEIYPGDILETIAAASHSTTNYEDSSHSELIVEATNQINPSCPGSSDGVIILAVNGGSGQYQYSWSHDVNLDQGYALDLTADTYVVEVTDEVSGVQKILEVTLHSPQEMELDLSAVIYPGCNVASSGQVTLDISGGTPPFKAVGFTSHWENGELIVTELGAGTYNFLISDDKGCSKTISLELPNSEPLEIDFEQVSPTCVDDYSGTIIAQASGGIPPYTYLWEDGTEGTSLTNIPVGYHSVTVTDSNFCSVTFSGNVIAGIPEVRMPTGFDPSQGVYQPISSCPISYQLMIFTHWGELIFNDSTGWDGLSSGEIVTGNYTYSLVYTFIEGGDVEMEELRGGFTLIK